MDLNITQNAVIIGKSINWMSIIIGIASALFGIYIWFYDRKNMKKATLYFPLFLACSDIIKVIENPKDLGEKQCRKLLENSAKTIDEIVYSHGSVVHLKKENGLQAFISTKKVIDEKLDFIKNKHWDILKETLESNDFKELKNNAEALLKICKEEVKEFKQLKE